MQLIKEGKNRLYVARVRNDVKATLNSYVEDDHLTVSYIVWKLYPVAIYDYVDPDWSDTQGWLQEIQDGYVNGETEGFAQYVCDDTFKELLTEFGYELVDIRDDYEITMIDYDKDEPKPVKISIKEAVNNALK